MSLHRIEYIQNKRHAVIRVAFVVKKAVTACPLVLVDLRGVFVYT